MRFFKSLNSILYIVILFIFLSVSCQFYFRVPIQVNNNQLFLADKNYFTCNEKKSIIEFYSEKLSIKFDELDSFSKNCYDAQVFLAQQLFSKSDLNLSLAYSQELTRVYPQNIYLYYLIVKNVDETKDKVLYKKYCNKYLELLPFVSNKLNSKDLDLQCAVQLISHN